MTTPPTPPVAAPTGAIGSLRDALGVLNAARRTRAADAPEHRVGLACGFTPLHLQTLLQAQLQARRPAAQITVTTGVYGALADGLDQLAGTGPAGVAVVIEWADLDPRLGRRESVGALLAEPADVAATVAGRLARLRERLVVLAASGPVALALPALPLAPAYASPPGTVAPLEARLRALVADFAADVAGIEQLRIVAPVAVGAVADLPSDLRSGFPYTVGYAAALAAAFGAALVPVPARKGLITDLDDTLWRGLVGEVGPAALSWDLDAGSLGHALYQQQLQALARQGVLLAVATKNDPEPVARALARPDLLLDPQRLFPVVASWEPKPAAVARILDAWNIGPADVVFVDDNPMELAQVQAAFPGIEVRQFPTHDPEGIAALLETLRGWFARDRVGAEDELRMASIRAGAQLRAEAAQAGDEAGFLRDLAGRVLLDVDTGWRAPRALELINKTNQFTINGRRLDDAEWRGLGEAGDAVAATVTYTDRFGPLGVISVLGGRIEGRTLDVGTWVLSCRAFSRAVEHHVLLALLERYDLDEARIRFVPTGRNDAVARLLDTVGRADGDAVVIDRDALRRSDRIGIHVTEFGSA